MSLVECAVHQFNEDDNNDKPVFVVCNNHSRLHADVQRTLTNVPCKYIIENYDKCHHKSFTIQL